jgi:hypothetical protein
VIFIAYIKKIDRNKYYTMKEAMELTGICRAKLHKLCEEGYLDFIRSSDNKSDRAILKSSIDKILIWQSEFEPIPNFPDYTISKTGEIRKVTGKRAPMVMKFKTRKDGYYEVGLRNSEGKKHYITVHRLVALTYIPNESNLPQVNHIDENKLNNSVDNLEWCTASYNCNYGNRNKNISESLKETLKDKSCTKCND